MKRFSQRHGLATQTELNITPLLDLAFVLLIIFMITTPLVENSLDLVVPSSSTASTPVQSGKVQLIELDLNNQMSLNKTPISLEQLEAELTLLHAQDPDIAVLVRPDREIQIQNFIGIMDALNRAKITKVGVVTQKEEPKP